ncbi:MAG: hypothetical protein HRT53_16625 [Colwellia sp.]|nr:hypothetical protein [Colwellia sp.]
MKLVKLSTLVLLLSFLICANASEPSNLNLVNNCLKLNSSLTGALKSNSFEIQSGKVEGINKVSFHYQNFDKGFKGVCSNAQFFVKSDGLKGTEENQRYVFVWSAKFNAQAPELSTANIEYFVNQPENIKIWLQEKI